MRILCPFTAAINIHRTLLSASVHCPSLFQEGNVSRGEAVISNFVYAKVPSNSIIHTFLSALAAMPLISRVINPKPPLSNLRLSFSTQLIRPFGNGGQRFASSKNTSDEQVIFSGIQPTGVPHLGNYLGALKQWVHLQETSPPTTKLLFSIVDLHAITIPQDQVQLRRWKRESLATLLAVGLKSERSVLFYQSAVSERRGRGEIMANGRIGQAAFRTNVDSELYG
jgi:hypothetical protein